MNAIASSPPAETPSSQPPRLLDQVREAMHTRRYNARTEEIFTAWIRRFVLFHDNQFLTHLAVEGRVSASVPVIYNQAFITRIRQGWL